MFFMSSVSLFAQSMVDMGRSKKFMALPTDNQTATKANETNPFQTETYPAQTTGDAPENSSNYIFGTSTSGTLTDMTGSVQLLFPANDDVASQALPIGFDFWLQGNRYSRFNVTSNGYVGLSGNDAITGTIISATGPAGSASPDPRYDITGGTVAAPAIAAFGGDTMMGAGGKTHYKVIGSAPNRILVIEFLNMTIFYINPEVYTNDGTYQVRLYETTGQIEFVYGAMQTNGTTGAGRGTQAAIGYCVGGPVATPNPNPDGTFIDIDSATNTASTSGGFTWASYPVSTAIANLNSPVEGSRRVYSITSPATVTAPTGLNFTGVTPIAMTLNWTDSPDETAYGIYRSTDGTNFNWVGTAASNATSFNAVNLLPSQNYFWRVFAVNEGRVSTALAGTQASQTPGAKSCNGAGGNWNTAATWTPAGVPTNTDDVTIGTGCTITVDTLTAVALDVTVQSGGTLTYQATPASTLTVTLHVVVNSGGTISGPATGTVVTHLLSVGGDLTNNGTLDLSTNTNTAGVLLTFTGVFASNTFSGTGATTDIRGITVVKGSQANILEIMPSNLTVRGVTTDSAGYLTVTSGTLKVSGTFTMTNRTFATANYGLPAAAGFWLNNPNYTVAGQASTGASVTGTLRITTGAFNIGTLAAHTLNFAANSTILIEGGSVTSTGRFGVNNASNTISYTQSAGTVTVCTVGCTSGLGSFDLGTAGPSNPAISNISSTIAISGGTIIIQKESSAADPIDWRNDSGGASGITGGTLQFGNASSGSAGTFVARGYVPGLVIDGTFANTVTFSNILTHFRHVIAGNALINAGTTLDLGGVAGGNNVDMLFSGTNFVNNGTVNGSHSGINGTLNAYPGMAFRFIGTAAQTYSGSGVMSPMLNNLQIENEDGVTFTPTNQQVVNRINLLTGSITGTNKITLGNGGAAGSTIQIGAVPVGVSFTAATEPGTFDVAPTFNLGTGGQQVFYGRMTADRSTGNEINPSRTLTFLSIDTLGANITLAGGNLTYTEKMGLDLTVLATGTPTSTFTPSNTATQTPTASPTSTGTQTPTAMPSPTAHINGRVITGSNTLIGASGSTVTRIDGAQTGHVDGNFRKTFTGAGSTTFEVGTANGYSPVAVNATAGTFPANFTAKAVQGAQPNIPNGSYALSRYWALTGTGITADLLFNYLDPTDIPVTATEGAFVIFKYDGSLTQPGGIVNAAANTATITGVTSFSDWTLADPILGQQTPTATNTGSPSPTPTFTFTATATMTNTSTPSATATQTPPNCPLVVIPNNNVISQNARVPMLRYANSRSVYLMTAAELAAAGYANGLTPISIGWNYNNGNGFSGSAPMKIYMQNTADTTNTKGLSFTGAVAGMTTVHDATTLLPAGNGPVDIYFSGGSPFTYTGGGIYVAYEWGPYAGALSTTTFVLVNTTLTDGLSSNNTGGDTMVASSSRPETRLSSTNNNDAQVSLVYSYGEVPQGAVPAQVVKAVITNGGINSLTNLQVTLNVTGANSFTNMQIIPSLLGCGGQATVTFAGYTPANLGSDTITVSVPADDVAVNNSKSKAMNVTAQGYSYKHPGSTASGGFGLTSQGAIVGKFTTTTAKTLSDVRLEFSGATANTYKVVVYGDAGGTPDLTPLYEDATDRAVVAGPVTATLSSPISVGPGDFYVGIQQVSDTPLINLGFDAENPIRSGQFYLALGVVPSSWTDFAPGANFKPNIGLNFLAAGSVAGTITYGNPIGNPVPPRFVRNVSVASTVGSPAVGPVLTGVPGTYSLTGFGAGAYTIRPTKTGGPNTAVSSNDAARVAQGVSGSVPFVTQNQRFVADTSGNGGVTSNDAALIARFAAGLTGTGVTGQWRFFVTGAPSPLPTVPQTYNDSRSYASVSSALTGEDFVALLVGEVSGNYNPAVHPRPALGPERMTSVAAPRLLTPADSEVIIPVSVTGAAGKEIISYEFDLRYDPAVIQPQENPVDVSGTVSRGLLAVANPNEPGLLRVVLYGAYPIEANGLLLNLKFNAVGAPGSVSPLTFERMMFNEGDPGTLATDGMVQLSGAGANQAEITGRLLNSTGQGIPNARVTLTDTAGETRSIMSNSFGVYRFGGLQVGQTFTISVESRKTVFTPLTVSVTGQSVNVDMIAEQ